MTKAIFTSKVEPSYDDLPEQRYHFPRTHLRQAEAAIGDWIVYYEPRRTSSDLASRGGRQAYFATARVERIGPDSEREGHFYAYVVDYLAFDRPVPFKDGEHYYESGLRRDGGATSKGAFGRAVRNLSDTEYDLIVKAGFVQTLLEADSEASPEVLSAAGFQEEAALFNRPIVEMVSKRPFREAAFSASVKAAYGNTCAMTGLQIINGGGRSEVQAAHIRPVAAGGSDSVRNGLALSGTIHWMFDRGLVSIDDDFSILVAAGRLPDAVMRLLRDDRRIAVPSRLENQPHPVHLRYHRESIFKG
ncbi:MAG: HNH endonuclease [Xanthobacteraceae bacterium]